MSRQPVTRGAQRRVLAGGAGGGRAELVLFGDIGGEEHDQYLKHDPLAAQLVAQLVAPLVGQLAAELAATMVAGHT
jgi:diphthamide synthase (EF-2-diphthine--ammonia ligase)